jgi:hypothetical protein
MTFAYFELRGCRPADLAQAAACAEVARREMTAADLGGRTYWLPKDVYETAADLLGPSAYRGHAGAGFGSARGVWLVEGGPQPTEPPPGAPRGRRYVLVETKWGRESGLGPFTVEEDFVFRGFQGRDVEVGRVANYRYFLAPYRRDGAPLTWEELKKTWLWRSYLSNEEVQKALKASAKYGKREWWHMERMGPRAVARFKVAWRDVADRFIPAAETGGAVPAHTAHYVAAGSPEEAHYLAAILLAPQINAVIREISPWVGHVEPGFLSYFRIERYRPHCPAHRRLAELGREIGERGMDAEAEKEIGRLVKERC